MINITVKDIIEKCNGKLFCGDLEKECINFSTDTRKIKNGDIYIGLKGEKFNGSEFFEKALELGASVCILQDVKINDYIKEKFKDRAIILVDDTLKALQEIAKYKRSLYNIPVIAVTGSVGKTSTKDMIASVVAERFNVLKTDGNFNNHIGVPLTILRLKDEEALVIEMGMSNLGELSKLTDIVKPTIAVITNVGTAHIGNLGSRENILKAKLEILEGLQENGCVIINNDNDLLHSWVKNNIKYNTYNFGINNESDIMAKNIKINASSSNYEIDYRGKTYEVDVPIGGQHFIYNSLCAICVGNKLDICMEDIFQGIKNFKLTKSRMEIEKIGDITIINDCYNANFDSMKASIENLAKFDNKRKIAVLGDMLELGEFSAELHSNVGKEVYANKIDILIVVGKESKNISIAAKACGMNSNKIYECNDNDEAIKKIKEIINKGDIILIKASNGMHFNEIVDKLK